MVKQQFKCSACQDTRRVRFDQAWWAYTSEKERDRLKSDDLVWCPYCAAGQAAETGLRRAMGIGRPG